MKWLFFRDVPEDKVYILVSKENLRYIKMGPDVAIGLQSSEFIEMDDFDTFIVIDINAYLDKYYYVSENKDKMCVCGHPYYRHFDSYDENRYVGCKYYSNCGCEEFTEEKTNVRNVE